MRSLPRDDRPGNRRSRIERHLAASCGSSRIVSALYDAHQAAQRKVGAHPRPRHRSKPQSADLKWLPPGQPSQTCRSLKKVEVWRRQPGLAGGVAKVAEGYKRVMASIRLARVGIMRWLRTTGCGVGWCYAAGADGVQVLQGRSGGGSWLTRLQVAPAGCRRFWRTPLRWAWCWKVCAHYALLAVVGEASGHERQPPVRICPVHRSRPYTGPLLKTTLTT